VSQPKFEPNRFQMQAGASSLHRRRASSIRERKCSWWESQWFVLRGELECLTNSLPPCWYPRALVLRQNCTSPWRRKQKLAAAYLHDDKLCFAEERETAPSFPVSRVRWNIYEALCQGAALAGGSWASAWRASSINIVLVRAGPRNEGAIVALLKDRSHLKRAGACMWPRKDEKVVLKCKMRLLAQNNHRDVRGQHNMKRAFADGNGSCKVLSSRTKPHAVLWKKTDVSDKHFASVFSFKE
jgi:hypothetical protein